MQNIPIVGEYYPNLYAGRGAREHALLEQDTPPRLSAMAAIVVLVYSTLANLTSVAANGYILWYSCWELPVHLTGGVTQMHARMSPTTIHIMGFRLAGAYNVVGMLLFSKCFTNLTLAAIDPDVFSWLGQLAIVLWGLAYWSVAKSHRHVPLLIVVFAVEKLVYSLTWVSWLIENGKTIPSIAEASLLTATFYSVYGAGDMAFCVFFIWVAVDIFRGRPRSTT